MTDPEFEMFKDWPCRDVILDSISEPPFLPISRLFFDRSNKRHNRPADRRGKVGPAADKNRQSSVKVAPFQ